MDLIIGFIASSLLEIFKPTYTKSKMRYKEVSFDYKYNLRKLSRKLEIQADILGILSILFSYFVFIIFNNIQINHNTFMVIGAVIAPVLIVGINIAIHYILKERATTAYIKFGDITKDDLKQYFKMIFPWYKILLRALFIILLTIVFFFNEVIKAYAMPTETALKIFEQCYTISIIIVALKFMFDIVLYLCLYPKNNGNKNIYLLDMVLKNSVIKIEFEKEERTLLFDEDVYIDVENNLLITNSKGELTWYHGGFTPKLEIDGNIITPKKDEDDKKSK